MEFLVCKQDLGNYGLGDIIDIHPDGFRWGSDELVSDRLQVVNISSDAIGMTVANARVAYLPMSLYHCESCGIYLESRNVTQHMEAAHADDMWQDQAHTVRKSPEQLGISMHRSTKFSISIANGTLVEKLPSTDTLSVVDQNLLSGLVIVQL